MTENKIKSLHKLQKVTTIIEWDCGKNWLNQRKHGLALEQAQQVFQFFHLEKRDTRRDYGECRYIVLGILAERVVVVVYTLRGKNKRIISMRKANEREKKIYYDKRSRVFAHNS